MESEALESWTWSSDEILSEERGHAWNHTLQKISMPTARGLDAQGFHGDICNIVSPMGIAFSRMVASPQTISGSCETASGSIWLAFLIAGSFELNDGERSMELHAGDIIYGAGGRDTTLNMLDDFRMLYINIPSSMLHPRLLNPMILRIGALPSQTSGNRVFSSMLGAIAENLEGLTPTQIRPIEMSLSEFVIASLAEQSASRSFGNVSRAAHFQRICESIEGVLGDPELSVRKIAEEQHASPRYIQKLFEEADLSFGLYVRQRRLARCRADLASASYRNLSILDICFRWGFNDAAHFSRSFRAEFGATPREFRQSQLGKRLQ